MMPASESDPKSRQYLNYPGGSYYRICKHQSRRVIGVQADSCNSMRLFLPVPGRRGKAIAKSMRQAAAPNLAP